MNTIAQRVFIFTDRAGASGPIIVRIQMPTIVESHGGLIWRADVEVSNAGKIVKTWTGWGADSLQALETAVVLYQGEWPIFQKYNPGTWEEVFPDPAAELIPGKEERVSE